MAETMLIWVTRSAPFNVRTTRSLLDLGHRVLAVPVLEIHPADPTAPAREPDALIFTSPHGIRHHRRRDAWSPLPVYCVGAQTAAMARAQGYGDVRSAGGNVADLKALILRSAKPGQHFVHFGAREPAGNLVAELRAAGLGAELAVAYQSREAAPDQLRCVTGLLHSIEAIVVHSPRGAAVAARVARHERWRGRVYALSAACAAPFATVPGLLVETALAPTEDSLMATIRRHERRATPARTRRRGLRTVATPAAAAATPSAPARLVVSNDLFPPSPAGRAPEDGPEEPPPAAA